MTVHTSISHVWVDGLGSSTEEGLHSCQVQRIHELVTWLLPGKPPAFWIDSLCIPKQHDLRKAAIRLMGDTYKNADRVLVLDASIRVLAQIKRRLVRSPIKQKVKVQKPASKLSIEEGTGPRIS